MDKSQPIIIVGSGVYGLSSAYHLATAGYTNIKVFDRGDYDNNEFSPLQGADGASTDVNKLVRASYVDKVHYQDLAVEALHDYHEWNEQLLKMPFLPRALATIQERCLQEGDLEPIFQNTGYIRLDDYENGEEERNLHNFEKAGLRKHSYDINNADDITRAKITGWYRALDPLNQREKVPTLTGVLDSFAGVALADKCLIWVRYLCERTGNVQFIYGPGKGEVSNLVYSAEDSLKVVGVKTVDGKEHQATKVVLAAGGWTPKFVPESLSPRLEAMASTYIMIQIPRDRRDLINKYRRIPMINWRMTYESNFRSDAVYVFPATHDGILKMGVNDHYWRNLVKVGDEMVSIPDTNMKLLPKQSLLDYQKFIKEFMPDLYEAGASIEKTKICFSSVGQQNELVIDFVPSYKNLLVCAGGGFHGYKFLPVIGRFTEGLISGKQYSHSQFFKFDYIDPKDYKPIVKDPEHEYALNSVEFAESRSKYYDY
ncbi:FAD-dependent glycine/D-amino oxidase [Yamadazyma tenuis]|uniref:FAD dependent oxidoreductase n=1 Tax=Candida tenuis (strain ATCC 10573 / BCRC 21748 / CBS 615 / JCM 9827 / NBRC 10315 / NRRL Y-1498 / VKM Y-70) TaxID=590646 RepID=G3B0R6_CANTC|nr:FAD dependent oxidoreductase [Yamadazyma tenuis ATCC 10573]EGV65458.1 FAD dependent oxidoreductase [Yamadazyma tenuis ATCC 10573]WEJ94863.1 FAD-dependent glycine/D-amino oxidase [Yamadazyma tenuis]